jgi:hypothetical protein
MFHNTDRPIDVLRTVGSLCSNNLEYTWHLSKNSIFQNRTRECHALFFLCLKKEQLRRHACRLLFLSAQILGIYLTSHGLYKLLQVRMYASFNSLKKEPARFRIQSYKGGLWTVLPLLKYLEYSWFLLDYDPSQNYHGARHVLCCPCLLRKSLAGSEMLQNTPLLPACPESVASLCSNTWNVLDSPWVRTFFITTTHMACPLLPLRFEKV